MYGDTIENNQELANAYKVIYEHLEDENNHSLNWLLQGVIEGFTGHKDEVHYRAMLAAQNFIESFNLGEVN